MSEILLQNKLFKPVLRPSLVPRPHLIEKLNAGLAAKLTLVSAPAGYGKTTLVASWLTAQQVAYGWLSLDAGENDPGRFLAHAIAALESAAPGIGTTALALLHSPQPPFQEALITLVNELAEHGEPLLLVLDDYHLIAERVVHDLVTFLLDLGPPSLHLVIVTRADPPLPLPRLRARAQLVEVRQEQLRFAGSEVTAFLNEMSGLLLSPDQVASVEERTEGWVAGLQMTALALDGQEDSRACGRPGGAGTRLASRAESFLPGRCMPDPGRFQALSGRYQRRQTRCGGRRGDWLGERRYHRRRHRHPFPV